MPSYKKSLGDWGESVAITHMEQNQFTIREKKWRCRFAEIDIIASKMDTLRFIEVKTRKGRSKGSPEEAITPKKAQKLMQAGLMYIGEKGLGDIDWQIDLMAIELDRSGKLIRCEHLENFVTG